MQIKSCDINRNFCLSQIPLKKKKVSKSILDDSSDEDAESDDEKLQIVEKSHRKETSSKRVGLIYTFPEAQNLLGVGWLQKIWEGCISHEPFFRLLP